MPDPKPQSEADMTPVQYLKMREPNKPIADILADIFRKRILSGEYLPGTKLVETEITELYGVSRGPVREAFKNLISDGLLEAQKHKSPIVRGVGKEQFAEMFQVRGVLEGLAARIVAERIEVPAVKAAVEDALATWTDPDFDDNEAFVSANTYFHELLRDLSANSILTEQIDRIAIPGFKAVFAPTATDEDIAASAKEHGAVLSAILNGNGKEAERLMVAHVDASAVRVIQNYSEDIFDHRRRELARLKGAAGV